MHSIIDGLAKKTNNKKKTTFICVFFIFHNLGMNLGLDIFNVYIDIQTITSFCLFYFNVKKKFVKFNFTGYVYTEIIFNISYLNLVGYFG